MKERKTQIREMHKINPVPPKPEDLPKERQKLVRMFGADKKAEARINEVMRDLKERSYAFWGRK